MSTPASVEAELGWALGTVTRTYLRAVGEVMAEMAGGPRGYLVLVSLGTGEPSTQVALAQDALLHPLDTDERTQLRDLLRRLAVAMAPVNPCQMIAEIKATDAIHPRGRRRRR